MRIVIAFAAYFAVIVAAFSYPVLWFAAAAMAWGLLYAIEVKKWL